ncbi:MAG: tetratricopeptide repeat protein [Candidatus Obscuribacterales bacterium]
MIVMRFVALFLIVAILLFNSGLHVEARGSKNSAPDSDWTRLANLGGRALSVGDYKNAEEFFIRGLKAASQAFGNESEPVAASVNNLGGLYMEQGLWEEAATRFKLALSIRRKVLSNDDPKLANTLYNLGICSYNLDNLEAAEDLIRESLDIRTRIEGNEGLSVASEMLWLSRVYEGQLRYKEAEGCIDRSIAIYEKHLGPKNKETLKAKQKLNELLEREAY